MKRVLLLVVMLVVASSCRDLNEDLQNCTGLAGNSVSVTVKFKGATGVLNDFVQDFATPPTDALQVAPDTWKFTWNLTSTPVAPAFTYHVGATLKSGSPKIDSWSYDFSNTYPSPVSEAVPAALVPVSGIAVSVVGDPALGYVLHLSNLSPDVLRVESLRWTGSALLLPLQQLVPGDPDVEALAWADAPLTVPYVLNPGTGTMVDIPDNDLLAANVVLARMITGRNAPGTCDAEGIYQSTVDDVVSGIGVPSGMIALHQNFPNPFSGITTIPFVLGEESSVSVDVYDVHGRHIRRLVNAVLVKGSNECQWDGKDKNGNDVATGVYLYQLNTGRGEVIRKMVLLR
jgi:hypothetical protein